MLAKLVRLSGGNAFAQLINFIAISYVSRIVGPEEYGSYALVVSISLITTAFVTLKGDNIIYSCTNVQDVNEAAQNLVGFIARVISLLVLVALVVVCFNVNIGGILVLSFLLSLFNSIIIILSAYFIQIDKISSHLKLLLIRPFLMFIVQGGVMLISSSYILLCIGKMTADLFVATTRLRATSVHFKNASVSTIRMFIVRYKFYCFHGTSASVLNILNQQLALIASPFIYNGFYTGHLGLALSLVIAPIGIVLSPLRGLVIKKVSHEDITLLSYSIYTLSLGILAVIIYLVAYLVTPYIVSGVWGDEWPYLSDVITILVIWPLSSLLSSYGYSVIIANNKQKVLLNVELVYLIARTVMISYCFYFNVDFMTYVVVIAIIGFTYNMILSLVGMKEVMEI